MIPIIYEDQDILILNKPSGIHSTRSDKSNAPSVADFLLKLNPEFKSASPKEADCGLVNRLDFETSGILLAAKSERVWNLLHKAILAGKIEKHYLALLEGELKKPISFESYIGNPNRGGSKVRIYDKRKPRTLKGKTLLHPIRYFEEQRVTLVEIEAHTARRHQIRAHASHLGWPLIGDEIYRAKGEMRSIWQTERIPAFFLHAYSVVFCHPTTDNILRFKVSTVLPPWLNSTITKYIKKK